ncbi:hypothetical protein L798_08960 [Zootermopsis nevadensis]|uniref:Uncharacterized protein n=1 Tax=Zootermopsis nevadensis TaxID=136037 RepID=A0A067RK26_ZOONE|nr:hypothetical protein L798_08960 [Zootermopsis nevadensis]
MKNRVFRVADYRGNTGSRQQQRPNTWQDSGYSYNSGYNSGRPGFVQGRSHNYGAFPDDHQNRRGGYHGRGGRSGGGGGRYNARR